MSTGSPSHARNVWFSALSVNVAATLVRSNATAGAAAWTASRFRVRGPRSREASLEGLPHELDHASRELFGALVRLHDLPSASARCACPAAAGRGWEEHAAAAAAREVARLAHRAADLARVQEGGGPPARI